MEWGASFADECVILFQAGLPGRGRGVIRGRGRGGRPVPPVPPVVPSPAPGPTLVAGPPPILTPADRMLG